MNRRIAAIGACAVLVLAAAPFFGAKPIDWSLVWQSGTPDSTVFWELRLPRVCAAFLAGAGLALGGMAFQALFRNPLATPFTLGVSSGASLGVAITMRLGIAFSFLGVSAASVGAFLGATAAIAIVYGLTRLQSGFTTATMLLAGVAAGFFFSSLILFIQYTADMYDSFRLLRWLMGGLDVVGFAPVRTMVPFVLISGVALLALGNELNLYATGEELAASRGLDIGRTKLAIFLLVSLMAGGIVSVCGPIGFVGMMAPHICRLIVGANHRVLGPASALFGGAFLVACDTLARTLLAPAELPVGVLTALLGGPFFLWLLVRGTAEPRG